MKSNSTLETRSSDVVMNQVSSDSVSQEKCKLMNKEHFKKCIKSNYKIRKIKNKGALMVLAWTFLLASVYYNLFALMIPLMEEHRLKIISSVILTVVNLMLPVSGWLADVYFGRYKVIKWSILTMWIVSILLVVSLIMAQQLHYDDRPFTLLLLIPLGISYGGFQANVIQFGIDQLTDASTTEITSFIAWYVWAFVSSRLPCDLIKECLVEYKIFTPFLMSVFLTIATASILLFNHVLVKEPHTQNPFKLVYSVIEFAIKNKYPIQRSAFTYCEDEQPSRIDFGKSKYGGPFTTEQVEDVKTLLRLLVVIVIGNVIGDLAIISTEASLYKKFGRNTVTQECIYRFTISAASIQYVIAAFLIPLCEFIFYPLCCQFVLGKFVLGAFFSLLVTASYIILFSYARYIKHATFSFDNVTLLCLFQENSGDLGYFLDYRWFFIPDFLNIISLLLIAIGAIEFFCAQIPYSMKGLVAGIVYGLLIIIVLLDKLPTSLLLTQIHWSTGMISCTFWYLLIKFILSLLAITTLLLAVRSYKNRKRDDVLPNEHIFAERYYSAN